MVDPVSWSLPLFFEKGAATFSELNFLKKMKIDSPFNQDTNRALAGH